MNKKQFLHELENALKNFRNGGADGVLRYYDELISDKVENGMIESEAVDSLGNVNDIVSCVRAELVETRIKEEKSASPVKTFISLAALCTSPVLFIIAFSLSIVYVVLLATFFAVGAGIFGGGIWMAAGSAVNAFYAYGQIGWPGVLIAAGIGLAAAGVMCFVGMIFYKLAMILIKLFLKSFARIISKAKRRRLNENFN